jgi:hypothetical protein
VDFVVAARSPLVGGLTVAALSALPSDPDVVAAPGSLGFASELATDEGEGPVLAAARASFFAQPLPLKWMAGVDTALRVTPPHDPHVEGPRSWMP